MTKNYACAAGCGRYTTMTLSERLFLGLVLCPWCERDAAPSPTIRVREPRHRPFAPRTAPRVPLPVQRFRTDVWPRR